MEKEFYEKTIDEQKIFLSEWIKNILLEIKNEIWDKKEFNPEKIQDILDNIKLIQSKGKLYELLSDIKIWDWVNAKTYFNNWKFNKIWLNENNFENHNNYWILLLLYHELTHSIWRDMLYQSFPRFENFILKYFNNNEIELKKDFPNYSQEEIITYISRENYTKILSFRKYMIDNNYSLDIEWIEKLFNFIKNEILKKQNKLFQVEEIELYYVYERFKENKEDLLFYLQKFVKLEKLKIENKIV